MINTLTVYQIRKATRSFVIGTAAMAVACSGIALTPTEANAVISSYSCSKGGFTGTIIIDHTPVGKFLGSVVTINYKIDKGRNRGGNKANIYYDDKGALTQITTGDTSIQDNNQHELGGPYIAGRQKILATFIFDKSSAPNPRCTTIIQAP